MKTTLTNLLAIAFTSSILLSCYPKMIYCGPEKTNPKMVYKKPNDRYKDVAKTFTIKNNTVADLTQTLGNKANITNDFELGTQLTELRDKLNNNSIRFSELLYRAAEAYNQNVCSETAENRYFTLLDSSAVYLMSISEIESKIQNSIATTNLGDSNTDSLKMLINEFKTNIFFSNN